MDDSFFLASSIHTRTLHRAVEEISGYDLTCRTVDGVVRELVAEKHDPELARDVRARADAELRWIYACTAVIAERSAR